MRARDRDILIASVLSFFFFFWSDGRERNLHVAYGMGFLFARYGKWGENGGLKKLKCGKWGEK